LHAGGHRFDSDILHIVIQSLGVGWQQKVPTGIFKKTERLKKVFRQTKESGRKDDKVTTL
jgi:hypothetical protein